MLAEEQWYQRRVRGGAMGSTALLLALLFFVVSSAPLYKVELTSIGKTPVISHVNPKGQGYTPCNLTFNPAWLPPSSGLPRTGLLVRAAECPNDYGGSNDHIMFAPCDDTGKCGDLEPAVLFGGGAEDPRVVFYEGFYYNYYYAPGTEPYTVKLAKTKTPLNATSWEHVATLPWHRNGCLLLRDQPPHYVLYGEGPDPLPGIGIASTMDLIEYKTINSTFLLPLGPELNEIKLEAGTPPVKLSTGDYLHFYAAATPGWVAHGNYTAGYIILSGEDPTKILQRSTEHIMVPLLPYEQGTDGYPWSRHNVVFLCSAVPTGKIDEFRLWFGAADASVGTAIVQVTKL
eukprot:TRINITY_DN13_c0_g1_i1.p2 TRINITY_DN13_c0_g1~~TRINITY_DN13_c0_g1_i1.p2  ORF type:complete len:344 (-),score=69.43 TRINITY_DN13_c0_g1_i1:93-1124(-)